MMIEDKRTRRGFIAGATVTAVGTVAFAQSAVLTGSFPAGLIKIIPGGNFARAVDKIDMDTWAAAINSLVYIYGEHGTATSRILSVAPAPMGGERPAGLREEALIVTFETAQTGAPDGDRTYRMQTMFPGVNELFLTRGADVFDKAILMAVLN